MSGSKGFWKLLLLWGVMAAVVSEITIAVPPGHDCSGEGCPVCLLIQQAEHSIRLKCAAAHSVFSPAGSPAAALILPVAVFPGIPLSSIRLKVKMNR
ncbi:MAG: hypothetical protein LBH70_04940 [Spirochaetaceae bacterium]|nr:hypothetical protein [Spirochaetaceae bacterium]